MNYIRYKEKREVDFVLSEKGRPFCLIECKTEEETLSPNLIYFQKKLSLPVAIQILHKPGVCKRLGTEGMTQWIISADQWLPILPWRSEGPAKDNK